MVSLTSLIAPISLTAQQAYLNSGRIILDSRVSAGMAAGMQTDVSKTAVYDTKTPSSSSEIADNRANAILNAVVYHVLEIAPGDLNGGAIAATGAPISWLNAYNGCKSLTHNGNSDWRLPTERELILMWIFKPAIEDLNGVLFASGENQYLSATEQSGSSVWSVRFSDGDVAYGSKSSPTSRYARCVREVTP